MEEQQDCGNEEHIEKFSGCEGVGGQRSVAELLGKGVSMQRKF